MRSAEIDAYLCNFRALLNTLTLAVGELSVVDHQKLRFELKAHEEQLARMVLALPKNVLPAADQCEPSMVPSLKSNDEVCSGARSAQAAEQLPRRT